MDKVPMNKGINIGAHIKRLKNMKGPKAVGELAQLYGKPLDFQPFKDYPTKDEEQLIECCVKIMNPKSKNIEIEAGHYHFDSFLTTPFAQTVLKMAENDIKGILRYGELVINSVHKNMKYVYRELPGNEVEIIFENCGYSLRHYQGFFEAFLKFLNRKGKVIPSIIKGNDYRYLIRWEN